MWDWEKGTNVWLLIGYGFGWSRGADSAGVLMEALAADGRFSERAKLFAADSCGGVRQTRWEAQTELVAG